MHIFNSVDDPKIDNVGNISGLNYKKNIYIAIYKCTHTSYPYGKCSKRIQKKEFCQQKIRWSNRSWKNAFRTCLGLCVLM